MEYGNLLANAMTALEARISSNNPSIPLTVYRKSRRNSVENIVLEIDQMLAAYYGMIDDAEGFPLWQRKIEEELGQQMQYMAISMDESVRDNLVATSSNFSRFVNIK